MATSTYILTIPGEAGTARLLASVYQTLDETARRLLLFAVRGSSRIDDAPSWLDEATAVTPRSVDSGSVRITLEAPHLVDAMGRGLTTYEDWPGAPDREDTVLSLLQSTLRDVWTEEERSPCFDDGVLESLAALLDVFPPDEPLTPGILSLDDGAVNQVSDSSSAWRAQHRENNTSSSGLREKVKALRRRIPPPQKVEVRGTVKQTAWSRDVLLDANGCLVRCRFHSKDTWDESLPALVGEDVVVTGKARFSPDGTPQFMEPTTVDVYDEDKHEHRISSIPEIRRRAVSMRAPEPEASPASEEAAHRVAGRREVEHDVSAPDPEDYLEGLWGVWPGDEPLTDLLDALND